MNPDTKYDGLFDGISSEVVYWISSKNVDDSTITLDKIGNVLQSMKMDEQLLSHPAIPAQKFRLGDYVKPVEDHNAQNTWYVSAITWDEKTQKTFYSISDGKYSIDDFEAEELLEN